MQLRVVLASAALSPPSACLLLPRAPNTQCDLCPWPLHRLCLRLPALRSDHQGPAVVSSWTFSRRPPAGLRAGPGGVLTNVPSWAGVSLSVCLPAKPPAPGDRGGAWLPAPEPDTALSMRQEDTVVRLAKWDQRLSDPRRCRPPLWRWHRAGVGRLWTVMAQHTAPGSEHAGHRQKQRHVLLSRCPKPKREVAGVPGSQGLNSPWRCPLLVTRLCWLHPQNLGESCTGPQLWHGSPRGLQTSWQCHLRHHHETLTLSPLLMVDFTRRPHVPETHSHFTQTDWHACQTGRGPRH